jgi:hypothetical protein
VHVASEGAGLGSTFTVRLPLRASRQEGFHGSEEVLRVPPIMEAPEQPPVSEELVSAVAALLGQAAH